MHARVEDGTKVRKEAKNKKKKSKKDVVCNDVGFNSTQNEAVHVKDYVEVIDSNRKENDQKTRKKLELLRDDKGCEKGLKKQRRIGGEATVVKDFSDVKFHDGGEKKRSLKLNEENNDGDNCVSKARKDKRRSHRENSDKYATDSISFLMEIHKCNKKGKYRVVMGQKITEKEDIAKMKNGEERNRTKKNKKGKRDKESSVIEGKDGFVDAKEIGKVKKYYDGNIMEKLKHGKQAKREDKG